jgi:ParB family chromosome partitioning protein
MIVDGHNRYEICQKHGIEFMVAEKKFNNIDEVKQWMFINQAGRRNLDADQLKYTIGKIYNSSKVIGFRGNRYTDLVSDKLSYTKNQPEVVSDKLSDTKKDTAKEVADRYNLSDRTIVRYGKLAEEFDKLAETKPELFQQVKSGEKTLSEVIKNNSVLVTKMTGDAESYTPSRYIEASRIVMGSIDTDPSSNNMAQATVKAITYYTIEDDGLTKEWDGNVFLNPPYNHGIIDKFIDKLIEEIELGNTTQAILLTNNNTDTQWFKKAATNCSLICFTTGRINFNKPDGTVSSPTNGQTFFYFGDNKKLFKDTFNDIGLIMEVI